MLFFASLLCRNCENTGEDDRLYDSNEKRPIRGSCSHAICEKCFNKDKEQNCPYCGFPKAFEAKIVDFASAGLIEKFQSDPIFILEQWWNSKELGNGLCSNVKCNKHEDLRICVQCENQLPRWKQCIEPVPISNSPPVISVEPISFTLDELLDADNWEMFFETSEESSSEDEQPAVPTRRTQYKFRSIDYWAFSEVRNRVFCDDCVSELHEGHGSRKLAQLVNMADEIKRITLPIIEKLLWREMRVLERECKLQYWRMLRTLEVLMHYLGLLYPLSQRGINVCSDTHRRKFSSINKFFRALEYHKQNEVSRELVEGLISSLKQQFNSLQEMTKNQGAKCQCTEIFDKLRGFGFKNKVEQRFAEMVEASDLGEFTNDSECLLKRDSNFKALQELGESCHEGEKMSVWKLHLIPRVMCYSDRPIFNKLCGIFDCNDRKPYRCRKCSNSICSVCVKGHHLIRCPACGWHFRDLRITTREDVKLEVNFEVMELLDFYKRNCVDVYEAWWNSKPSGSGYCLVCASYSDQLEICAFCELAEKRSSIRSTSTQRGHMIYRQNQPLLFKSSRLKRFLLRIQCSQCKQRLNSEQEHSKCGSDLETSITWRRGCNHLRYRVFGAKCRGYDISADTCEFNVIALKDIGNYELAMKLAELEVTQRILRAGIEEINSKCRLRRMRALRTQELIKQKSYKFLVDRIYGKATEKGGSGEISVLIENLKLQLIEMTNQEDEELCRCSKLWDRASPWIRSDFKLISKFRLDQVLSGCPLHFDHGVCFSEPYPFPDFCALMVFN